MMLEQRWLVVLMDAATRAGNVWACILTRNTENVIPIWQKGKPKTCPCILGIQLVLVTDKDHAFW